MSPLTPLCTWNKRWRCQDPVTWNYKTSPRTNRTVKIWQKVSHSRAAFLTTFFIYLLIHTRHNIVRVIERQSQNERNFKNPSRVTTCAFRGEELYIKLIGNTIFLILWRDYSCSQNWRFTFDSISIVRCDPCILVVRQRVCLKCKQHVSLSTVENSLLLEGNEKTKSVHLCYLQNVVLLVGS